MNEEITYSVLQAAINCGVKEFIVCAGSRNSSFVEALRIEERFTTYYWPEERSAAFFALGRSRCMNLPVAVITTSGTAAGELLPATMEAYYTNVPLLLITADRPMRLRGCGSPQTAEQVGIFGSYVRFSQDLARPADCDLSKWGQEGPAHLNVCLEEPRNQPKFVGKTLAAGSSMAKAKDGSDMEASHAMLDRFFKQVERPLVIVSTLRPQAAESTVQFLLSLNAPVMLEGISGIREDARLHSLAVHRTEKVLERAALNDYAVDGVLRVGGVPTHRIWRDLEDLDHMQVCSISEQPYSGLSWNRNVICGSIDALLSSYRLKKKCGKEQAEKWLRAERDFDCHLAELFEEEPNAEPSLLNALSEIIPEASHVYLGNSLPIREWDLSAVKKAKCLAVTASRGLAGIDGQISTFLGLCQPQRENWGIFGDLTTLYDLAGCWILPQMENIRITLVVVNNGGGKIFYRMFPHNKEMLNSHKLNFEPLANMWGLAYQCWQAVPESFTSNGRTLLEIVPDEEATIRFWSKLEAVKQKAAAFAEA